jgi:hypothetical protein
MVELTARSQRLPARLLIRDPHNASVLVLSEYRKASAGCERCSMGLHEVGHINGEVPEGGYGTLIASRTNDG